MSRWSRKTQRAAARAAGAKWPTFLLSGDVIAETRQGVVMRLDESPGVAAITVLVHPGVSTEDAASELRILAMDLEELSCVRDGGREGGHVGS